MRAVYCGSSSSMEIRGSLSEEPAGGTETGAAAAVRGGVGRLDGRVPRRIGATAAICCGAAGATLANETSLSLSVSYSSAGALATGGAADGERGVSGGGGGGGGGEGPRGETCGLDDAGTTRGGRDDFCAGVGGGSATLPVVDPDPTAMTAATTTAGGSAGAGATTATVRAARAS